MLSEKVYPRSMVSETINRHELCEITGSIYIQGSNSKFTSIS